MNRRKRMLEGLDEDIREHIAQRTQENIDRGMSPEEARFAALRKFGNVTRAKEDTREIWSFVWLEELFQDIRYALRTLAKNPGFTAIAVLSLTLGIGGTTTIFTLVKGVFLQNIPVKDPSTAVVVYSTQQTVDGKVTEYLQNAFLNAKDYRENNDAFAGLAMFMDAGDELEISGSTAPIFADVQLVNWDFFDVLGVRPALGRDFAKDEDETPDARPVVILSYALWNAKFAADAHIVGQNIRLNGQDYNVIGVMPKEFQQVGAIGSPDLWAPMMMHDQLVTDPRKDWFMSRRGRLVFMVGRLKAGVSFDAANNSMRALSDHLAEEYPAENSGRNVVMVPLSETNVPPVQRNLFVLVSTLMMGIVILVLLIACGNVANLLLAREMQRRRELAIRLSLGASRWRLIRQLLTEGLLLGFVAAALGVVCAYGAIHFLWTLLPGGKPQGLNFSLDGRVLLFTLGLSVVATLIFGLVPSLQVSNPRQMSALRDRADSQGGAGRWYALRGILVMAQIAFSLIALVGSALFIHSLRNAEQLDTGFETKRELLVFLDPSRQNYRQERTEQYYRDAAEKVRALPAVADAGIANSAPFSVSATYTTFPEGVDTSDLRNASQFPVVAVGPGYFSAAGIPLLRGRDVNDFDDPEMDQVVVINQALADHLWKGQDPIGRRLTCLAGQTLQAEVIGVVGNVKVRTLEESPEPILYFSLKQMYFPNAVLYVRTKSDPRSDPDAALSSVWSAVQSLDPAIPLDRLVTVSSLMDQMVSGSRLAAELLMGFGALALLLAAVGTYGVMSYSVSQRTQEIGIRMALGAQRGDVLRLILQNGMAMVIAGVVAGLGLSVIFTRSINSLLYGIGSFDLASFFAAAVVLIVVALVACWLPARRAMRVDPVVALRYE
ncbi:MAG TPA: ABC transporter permease [Candidatus Acidoferrales bacterium]